MQKILRLLLPMLLIAGIALADSQARREKMADERPFREAVLNAGTSVNTAAATWYPTALGNMAGSVYNQVDYLPGGVIWISGYDIGSPYDDWVLRSTDNGATWRKIKLSAQTFTNGCVFAAIDADTAVIGTFGDQAGDPGGEIYRTTNGGSSWTLVMDTYSAGAGFMDGIKWADANTVIAYGDADATGIFVGKSTDAGRTWTRLTNLPAGTANALYGYATYRQGMEIYGTNLWITLYSGSGTFPWILKSTDLGDNWTVTQYTLPGGASNNYYFKSINFADANLGFAVTRRSASGSANDNFYYKTTDGGATWSDTLEMEPGQPHAGQKVMTVKPIRGTNTVIAGGYNGANIKLWISTDGGTTFTPEALTNPGDIRYVGFTSETEGYVAGYAALYSSVNKTFRGPRKVTFNVNTATVPDTIPVAGSNIQIRGGLANAGAPPITWGNDAQNNMTHVGGDYWKTTLDMMDGDTLRYKYVIGYSSGTGWEQNTTPPYAGMSADNRGFIVGTTDTVVDLEFWNNGANGRAQYFKPWSNADTSYINVYFRVSMLGPISSGSFAYNNNVDTVGVRGGGPAGGDLNWSPTYYLTRESPPSNGDGYTVAANSFWSGGLRLPKAGVTAGQDVSYKFLIGYDWGRDELQSQPNRSFKVPVGLKDTTLQWVFFNNERPSARVNADTVVVTYRANLALAVQSGGFSIGDTLWARSGYFGSAAESGRGKMMARSGGTTYLAKDTIVTSRGKNLDYQYYHVVNGVEVRELYYNFYYNGDVGAEAERRQIVVPASGDLAVLDTATSATQARRQPDFPNSRKLKQNVVVTYTVNIKPVFYQIAKGDTLRDIQGTRSIYEAVKDSILKWGVWMNGLAVGDWTNPGGTDWDLGLELNLTKKMYDDGTNGDAVAGDTVFTRLVNTGPDSTRGTLGVVGQVFKFGIWAGDNEAGRGGFGNNHKANIVDDNPTFTMKSQFGSINPAFYSAWDYDKEAPVGSVSVADNTKPFIFALEQNYPNPFNPSTKIDYSIPMQSKVELKIYNIVGQEVATLVNEVQGAGVHSARFDATKLASGVYFYRLTAGNFTSVKKMALLK